MSCETLLQKLLAWIVKNDPQGEEARRFGRWKTKYGELIDYVHERQREFWGEQEEEEPDEDVVPLEMIEAAEKLNRTEYKLDEMMGETIDDLHTIAEFLENLRKFKPGHDDKLKALVRLLKSDPVLKRHKVLIFTEYMATARYLRQQLSAAGIGGVDEVDSASDRDSWRHHLPVCPLLQRFVERRACGWGSLRNPRSRLDGRSLRGPKPPRRDPPHQL